VASSLSQPDLLEGVQRIAERRLPEGPPLWVHPQWRQRFEWLVQGTTGAGEDVPPFDLGLFGASPAGEVTGRWWALRHGLGMPAAVHARQVHGAELSVHAAAPLRGLHLGDGIDGHVSRVPGLLLAVSVADCVPVFLVDARRRALALLHAGWKGVAGGILEAGLARMLAEFESTAADLWMHCGPAICGHCYEVGPEVHASVRPDLPTPHAPTPIDLRAALAARALDHGLAAERITLSSHCTLCGGAGEPGSFFSHRGGRVERQMALLGVQTDTRGGLP
jgi:polyphenol oxidase